MRQPESGTAAGPRILAPFRGGGLAALARRRTAHGLPGLILMTDERRLPDPLAAVARLPRGAGVIFRHYGDPERAILAARLARLCRARGLVLLVAGDAALAARVGAAGLHLAQAQGSRIRHFRRSRPRWLVTVAAHSQAALTRGRQADAVLLSPVFATLSHPGARALGALRFARLAGRSTTPVYALGGIDEQTLRRLQGCRLAGVAAIGGLAGGR